MPNAVNVTLMLRANGRKIVVQLLSTLLDVASVCTPCYMLFRVIRSCCTKFGISQTLSCDACKRKQQLPVMLGVVGQQCCVRLHGALISLILVTSSLRFSMVVVGTRKCKHVAVCSKIIENGYGNKQT